MQTTPLMSRALLEWSRGSKSDGSGSDSGLSERRLEKTRQLSLRCNRNCTFSVWLPDCWGYAGRDLPVSMRTPVFVSNGADTTEVVGRTTMGCGLVRAGAGRRLPILSHREGAAWWLQVSRGWRQEQDKLWWAVTNIEEVETRSCPAFTAINRSTGTRPRRTLHYTRLRRLRS